MSVMIASTYPVNPKAKNITLALTSKRIRVSSILADPAQPPRLNLTNVRLMQISLNMALNAGYGDLFASDLEAETNFYFIEFLATIPPIPAGHQNDSFMVLGAGVRIALATSKIENEAEANLASIAAHASSSRANHQMLTQVSGVPNAMNSKFHEEFGDPTQFDLDALKRFGTAVSNLSAAMVEEAKKANPQFDLKLLYVKEHVPIHDLLKSRSASACYALSRIIEGDSRMQAITRLRSESNRRHPIGLVDELIVESIYTSLVGTAGQPSEQAKHLASSLWTLGD